MPGQSVPLESAGHLSSQVDLLCLMSRGTVPSLSQVSPCLVFDVFPHFLASRSALCHFLVFFFFSFPSLHIFLFCLALLFFFLLFFAFPFCRSLLNVSILISFLPTLSFFVFPLSLLITITFVTTLALGPFSIHLTEVHTAVPYSPLPPFVAIEQTCLPRGLYLSPGQMLSFYWGFSCYGNRRWIKGRGIG